MVAVGNIQRRDGGKQPLQLFAQGRAIHHPHRLLHIILHKIIHRGMFAHPSRKRQLHRRGAAIGQENGTGIGVAGVHMADSVRLLGGQSVLVLFDHAV